MSKTKAKEEMIQLINELKSVILQSRLKMNKSRKIKELKVLKKSIYANQANVFLLSGLVADFSSFLATHNEGGVDIFLKNIETQIKESKSIL